MGFQNVGGEIWGGDVPSNKGGNFRCFGGDISEISPPNAKIWVFGCLEGKNVRISHFCADLLAIPPKFPLQIWGGRRKNDVSPPNLEGCPPQDLRRGGEISSPPSLGGTFGGGHFLRWGGNFGRPSPPIGQELEGCPQNEGRYATDLRATFVVQKV